MNPSVQILVGDAREKLKELPSRSVHCVVTSPPYWNLRDYGVEGQMGLEQTPEEFVESMVSLFYEVSRVLRVDGTCWINIGDTYLDGKLLGIPWRLALALQDACWNLRADIIWHKPNPVPEPDRGRPTVAHEYLFLLTQSRKYYYDATAIREASAEANSEPYVLGQNPGADEDRLGSGFRKNSPSMTHPAGRNKRTVWSIPTEPCPDAHFATFPRKLVEPCILAGTSGHGCCPECGAPWKRVVEYSPEYQERLGSSWHDHSDDLGRGQRGAPPAFRGGPALVTKGWEPTCEHGLEPIPCTVLDPFGGSGTTGEVALSLGRSAVLIELNPEYVKLIERKTAQQRLPLFGG